jgi:hypothetical protein
MGKITLEGGTDVAEMVIFCADSVPADPVDDRILEELENNNSIVRISTGADGGYLLHLYLDEKIDDEVFKYCIKDDALKANLNVVNGNLAFGGAESATSKFEPNINIRSDAKIEKGEYSTLVYHTDYPDELIEDQIEKEMSKENLKHMNLPGKVIGLSVIIAFIMIIMAIKVNLYYGLAAIALVVVVYSWQKKYRNTNKYIELKNIKNEIELKYPSIVAHMETINA